MARNVDEIVNRILALDLAPIKLKLMDDHEGEGWSADQAEAIEAVVG